MPQDWLDWISNTSLVSLTTAFLAIFITIVYYIFKSRGLPPGPIGVPLLGYWPFLDAEKCPVQLEKLKKKYGDIFCFTVTGQLYINLGSTKVTREAHITNADCFGSRLSEYSIILETLAYGVGFVNGEEWKVLRKFFIPILKERGMTTAKGNMTEALYCTVKSTIEHLHSKNGEPENFTEFLTDKCTENLCQTLFGDSVTQEQVREINTYYSNVIACMSPTNMLLTGNIAKFLFYFMPSVKIALENHKREVSSIYKIIDEHKTTYDEGNIRNLIDEYFKERDKRRSKGDPTAKYFTDQALMGSLVQFIGDGVLSVAVFISSFLKTAAELPEEQDKLYKELLEVVGLDREPTVEDRNKLPYMNAFILEALRHSDFFVLFPSQICTKETTLGGYRIPVGAVTVMNFRSAHFDPKTYEEPEKFNPSRFIIAEGGKRPELPISFGVGRRACLGEGFTMAQVFLFLSTIIQHFNLSVPSKNTDESINLLGVPGNLYICAHPRNKK